MNRFIVIALSSLVLLSDIFSALYSITFNDYSVGLFKVIREVVIILIASAVLLRKDFLRDFPISSALIAFVFFILVAAIIGLFKGVDLRSIVLSGFQLCIPVIFILVGASTLIILRDKETLFRFIIFISTVSIIFGLWEIKNTEFWADLLAYDDYLYLVKGIDGGFDPIYFLPWNFFGYGGDRRAAGLVAAPLAQGSLCWIALNICMVRFFSTDRKNQLSYGCLSCLLAYGVYASGTRGAMLATILSIITYFFISRRHLVTFKGWLVVFLGGVASFPLYEIFIYTINLEDGSTIGHLRALEANILNLHEGLLGGGLGVQGVYTDEAHTLGGGEGAIFSIYYQIGIGGFLCVLIIYIKSLTIFGRSGTRNEGNAIGICLLVGSLPTLVTSEHILTVSGMGLFWIILGRQLWYTVEVNMQNRQPVLDVSS